MKRYISKKDFFKQLQGFLKDFEIIGPKELANRGVFYHAITDVKELYLGEGFTIEPLKKYFLEPSSWLVHYPNNSESDPETIQQSAQRRIIIGARSCETRGLVLLDNVFNPSDDNAMMFKDSYYINNRKRSIIIGLACTAAACDCFCVSMGSSPNETRGMDILLFEDNEGFIVDMVTEQGKGLFADHGAELNDEQEKRLEAIKEKNKNSVKKKIEVPETLEPVFESDYWDEVSKSCISCGICTFLCPTCHCFDLVDEERKKLRCYDGCSFPDFTLEASGENPRPTTKERYRQRVFHKFDYFKKNFGENLCVGCGRCIRHCPVKIDIAEIAAWSVKGRTKS